MRNSATLQEACDDCATVGSEASCFLADPPMIDAATPKHLFCQIRDIQNIYFLAIFGGFHLLGALRCARTFWGQFKVKLIRLNRPFWFCFMNKNEAAKMGRRGVTQRGLP